LEDVSFALVSGAFTKKIVFSAKLTPNLARIYKKSTRILRVVAINLLKLAKSDVKNIYLELHLEYLFLNLVW